jgi:hypothetical protein
LNILDYLMEVDLKKAHMVFFVGFVTLTVIWMLVVEYRSNSKIVTLEQVFEAELENLLNASDLELFF